MTAPTRDEFLEEMYGIVNPSPEDRIAEAVAEAESFFEWQIAAEATDAYVKGVLDGILPGYRDGYTAGYTDGDEDGYDAGYDIGYNRAESSIKACVCK